MNFKTYPHDTQSCTMKIESCECFNIMHSNLMAKSYDCTMKFSVSHTTDDLVFLWDPLIPLVVDRIELPQLDLVKNETGDCTQVYSTGQSK
jgi:histamine-gated chloride channel